MREWTRQQLQAISERGGHMLVSAAAGSGKTAVLVERIIRRIMDEKEPVDVDRFLVMTFTNAAADEMKGRIRDRLTGSLMEPDRPEAEKLRLRRQIALLDNAWISTIDSVALRILREHTEKAGLDPSFRIADENEIGLIGNDVMEQLLEEKYEEASDDFIDLAEAYTEKNEGKGLPELIRNLCECAKERPWPDEWFEEALGECAVLEEEVSGSGEARCGELMYIRYLFLQLRELLAGHRDSLKKALELCLMPDGPKPYIPLIEAEIGQIENLLASEDYDEMARRAALCSFEKLAPASKKKYSEEAIEAAKKLRSEAKDEVKGLIARYLDHSPEAARQYTKRTLPYLRTLIGLAREYTERFRKARRDKGVVSIGEPAYMVLDVLYDELPGKKSGDTASLGHFSCRERERSREAREYAGRFCEIYIDEYQDSNYVQEALISAIDSGSTFMVGDVKQSIYRFRGAKPDLFLARQKEYQQQGGSGTLVTLSLNFRSRPKVLQGVNRLFQAIMGGSVGGVDYTPDAELHPGASWKDYPDIPGDAHEKAGEVQLLLAEAGEGADAEEKRRAEARMIAARIRELTHPERGLMIYDRKKETYRTARYADIVILLRSPGKKSDIYLKALREAGIPAYSGSEKGYFDSLEIRTMLAVLEVLDNPLKDIPLAAYLRSPAAGMTDEELAFLTAAARKEENRVSTLYHALQQAAEEAAGSVKDKAKASLERLDRYRKASEYMTIPQLITYIYDESGYYNYVSALPYGAVRRANLDKLRSMASDYARTGYRGLFHFIRYVNTLQSYDVDPGEAQTAGAMDDAVGVISIHKSKGLEYPVVFVSALDAGFNRQDERARVLCDGELGPACDYADTQERIIYPSLKKAVLKLKTRTETLGEEIRVLYVAMTRAVEQLYLTAAVCDAEETLNKYAGINGVSQTEDGGGYAGMSTVMKAGSFLDLILRCGVSFKTQVIDTESLIREQILQSLSGPEFIRALDALSVSEEKKAYYRGLYDYRYPFETEVDLAGKVSVTRLKSLAEEAGEHDETLASEPDLVPAAENEEPYPFAGQISGSSRGSVYHTVMEKLDYDKVTDDRSLNEYIDSLTASGKLTGAQAEAVYRKDILTFLRSETGRKAAKAFSCGRLFRERQFIMGIPAREVRLADSDETVLVQGVIDAYLEEDDGIILIDYKTDHVSSEAVLTERYRVQLDIYARALEMMKKKPVKEKLIWSFYLGRAIRIP